MTNFKPWTSNSKCHAEKTEPTSTTYSGINLAMTLVAEDGARPSPSPTCVPSKQRVIACMSGKLCISFLHKSLHVGLCMCSGQQMHEKKDTPRCKDDKRYCSCRDVLPDDACAGEDASELSMA